MFLRYKVQFMLRNLSIYILLLMCVSWYNSQAATLPETYEPMGFPSAPLGTVWVKELEPTLKRYHYQMMRTELAQTKAVGIHTNIALFSLIFRMKDGATIPILDRAQKAFVSGGSMLTDPKTESLDDVSTKRRQLEDDVKSKTELLKKSRSELTKFAGIVGSDQERDNTVATAEFTKLLGIVHQNEAGVSHAKQLTSELEVSERAYDPKLFSEQQKYGGFRNATYDPEQTIARIVDHHFQNAIINARSITINGVDVNINDIDSITLNVHSRTDMCPFCSMFLAHNLKEWHRKLGEIPVITVVTSRQEYRCEYPFIMQQPYYNGYSLRSFAWRQQDDGSSFEGIKKIASEGLVVQYAFQPWEIYSQPKITSKEPLESE